MLFRRFAQLACLLLLTSTSTAQEVDVWLGTTTPRNGLSRGIYHAVLNTASGEVSEPRLAAKIRNPGFLAHYPGTDVIYSTGTIEGAASVVAFRIGRHEGRARLVLINSQPIGDGGAAHLSVDRTGRTLLTAQYGGGSTAAFPLAPDGSIEPRSALIKHQGGSGVVASRQDKPHAHWIGTSPDNRFVFVPDLGMDQVVIYRLDAEKSQLTSHGAGHLPPGGGPRHMKFHTSGDYIYVLNELALSVTVFRYDSDKGTMTAIQTIPTVPAEEKEEERFVSASEIRMHPSGKFVYAANRGHDTITAFHIDQESGELTLVEREPIRGSWPRNFNVDPTGKWLLAAGRDSHSLAVFEIDSATGELTYTRRMVLSPSTICVLFGS